jgi:Sulfotransferase family
MANKHRVLYIASSSFSGSTLLSFLLNSHTRITTVGEMEGWKNANPESFRCSCGKVLKVCPFFHRIADAFSSARLPFHMPNDFGTGYRLLDNTRLNRYLTEALPWIRSSAVERVRDGIVRRLPPFAGRIRRNDQANELFIRTALTLAGAEVFVNADKTPFRLRYLRRIPELDLRVLHLLRDPHGVVLTFMENRGWDGGLGMRVWIREQRDILRILGEQPAALRVYYEDLCDDTNAELTRIHKFAGVNPEPFAGDFRTAEHHILGNSMRLDRVGTIVKSERWKSKLPMAQLESMKAVARDFVRAHPSDAMVGILGRYFDL